MFFFFVFLFLYPANDIGCNNDNDYYNDGEERRGKEKKGRKREEEGEEREREKRPACYEDLTRIFPRIALTCTYISKRINGKFWISTIISVDVSEWHRVKRGSAKLGNKIWAR